MVVQNRDIHSQIDIKVINGWRDNNMMIVRIKGNASAETQEVVRERIKEQISEGLVVHDDSVEITFADELQEIDRLTCPECGNVMEEIKAYADNEVAEVMYTCPFCEPQHD